ncbi:MAG TPA: DUF5658 family protein [Vicinamibacterales bacterium]|nr:DUF5658 family protein [Vicinamibacterales bacterium]
MHRAIHRCRTRSPRPTRVLDVYSTWRALETGRGREVNPVLRGVAGNVPAMLVIKGASTAASVYAVEHLWKRNRKAAVATMIGIKAAYGLVVARNFKVGVSVR